MNNEWQTGTKQIALISLLIFFVYLLYLLIPVMPLLIIAGLVAFLLIPLVDFLRYRLHLPRVIAVLLAYAGFFVVLTVLPLVFVPALIDAINAINVDVLALGESLLMWFRTTLEQFRTIQMFGISQDLSPVIDPALETLNNVSLVQFIPSLEQLIAVIPSTVEMTWGVASNVLGRITSAVLAFVLTLLYAIYMSLGGESYKSTMLNLVPEPYKPEMAELGYRIRNTWRAYFRGQLTLCVSIGLITWLFGFSVGLPGAFALAVIAGVLEFLPGLGPILAAVPAIAVALVQGSSTLDVSNWVFMLIVTLGYVLIQQLENNIIVPKILGEAMELDPLVVMVGVVAGAATGGILGALVAAPTIATGRTVLLYVYAKILGQPPFPPSNKPLELQPSWFEQAQTLWQTLQRHLKRFTNPPPSKKTAQKPNDKTKAAKPPKKDH